MGLVKSKNIKRFSLLVNYIQTYKLTNLNTNTYDSTNILSHGLVNRYQRIMGMLTTHLVVDLQALLNQANHMTLHVMSHR